jgi:hypothetical protein
MKIASSNRSTDLRTWISLFLTARLILLLATPLEGLGGYGDIPNYIQLAGLGRPFLDYWVEFPPLFPFLSAVMFRLANGQVHVYLYLFFILMTVFQAGNLYLFGKLLELVRPNSEWKTPIRLYFTILLVCPYGWWYFDPLAVFCMLAGVYLFIRDKVHWGGVAVGIGVLLKFFPALVLPGIWKLRGAYRAGRATALAFGLVLLAYGWLYLRSPQLTAASLASQASKGSWETVWALLDANLQTGNFGPYTERYQASRAFLPVGNPARIPAWLTLIAFGLLGVWAWLRARLNTGADLVAFVGFTWCIFLLWSPGWSPQWLLYLLPLILLALPAKEGSLLAVVFTLVNLLEWPVMLSRGYNWGLWITVPLRTLMLILAAFLFWRQNRIGGQNLEVEAELG